MTTSRAPRETSAEQVDRMHFDKVVLDRAAQYEVRLRRVSNGAGPATFVWRWYQRPFGSEFTNRQDAIDWMAEWLDSEAPSLPFRAERRKFGTIDEPAQLERESTEIQLGGEIDLRNAGDIGEDLCAAMRRTAGAILVDLSNVTFIDSSAISMMIRVHGYAEQSHRTVTWRGAHDAPARTLRITGVDRHLNITE